VEDDEVEEGDGELGKDVPDRSSASPDSSAIGLKPTNRARISLIIVDASEAAAEDDDDDEEDEDEEDDVV
jgi:hypothetical protein